MRFSRLYTVLLGAWAVLSVTSCAASRKGTAEPAPLRTQLSEQDLRRHEYFLLEAQSESVAGHPDEAFLLYQHALDIDPQSPVANYSIAPYYLFLGADSTALQSLETAVKYDPDNYWYSRMLALYYYQTNQAERAVPVFEQMTERFPDRQEPYFTLLDLYARQGEYEKMLAVLNRIEHIVGRNEDFTMQKFQLYLQLGRKDDAFQEVEGLVKEYPQDSRYRVLLGQTYLDNNRMDEARDIFLQVLEEEPDNVFASYSLADYYKATQQTEAYNGQIGKLLYDKKVPVDTKLNVMRQLISDNEIAGADSIPLIPIFDRILEEDPDDDQIPMLYSQYLWAKNKADDSAPVLEHILQLDPLNKAARLMLLQVFIRRNEPEPIARICEVGTEVTPDVIQFPFYWAIACLQMGNLDQAKTACLMAVDHLTGNEEGVMVSDIYSILGDICHEQALLADAYAAYDKALDYNPLNYSVLNNYAYFLSLEKRDLDRAEEMSYKTVQADSDNATYLDTYAWILFVKERYTEARIYIDNALKTEEGQTSSSILEHSGDIYYLLGERDHALQQWKKAAELENDSKTLDEKIRLKKYIEE